MIWECVQDTLIHLGESPLYLSQGQSDVAVVGSAGNDRAKVDRRRNLNQFVKEGASNANHRTTPATARR